MLKELTRSSGFAALAAALAASALPSQAAAQDDDRQGWSQRAQDRRAARAESRAARQEARAARFEPRHAPSPPPGAASAPFPPPAARGDQPPRPVAVPPSSVPARDPSGETRPPPRNDGWAGRRPDPRPAPATQGSARNRSYADGGRDRSYGAERGAGRADPQSGWAERRFGLPGQDPDGEARREEDRSRNQAWRGGHNDGRDWRDRDQGERDWRDHDRNRDQRRWDRRWHNDHRYDWRRWRDRNRFVFHIGIYYPPYRYYSYRPIGIGFYLDPLFFASRYWLVDPWRYRLPESYGPYRWVRYYDDLLLVDIYTGEVVDVIYDFFW